MTLTNSGDAAARQWLAALLAQGSGLPVEDLPSSCGFDGLALDSLSIKDFTPHLSQTIPGLPRSLLFDCRHLDDRQADLTRAHGAALAPAPSASPEVGRSTEPEQDASAVDWPALDPWFLRHTEPPRATTGPTSGPGRPDTAAIVGHACRYPEAERVSHRGHDFSPRKAVRTRPRLERRDHNRRKEGSGRAILPLAGGEHAIEWRVKEVVGVIAEDLHRNRVDHAQDVALLEACRHKGSHVGPPG